MPGQSETRRFSCSLTRCENAFHPTAYIEDKRPRRDVDVGRRGLCTRADALRFRRAICEPNDQSGESHKFPDNLTEPSLSNLLMAHQVDVCTHVYTF